MVTVGKKGLLLILPCLFFIIQCGNNATPDINNHADSTITPEDTSRRAGASAADLILSEKVNNALVFQIDDTMKIGVAYTSTLALGKDIVLADLKKDVEETSGVKSDSFFVTTNLKVAPTMRARLQDLSPATDRNFEIKPVTEGVEIQDINEETDNRAFWQWNITPLKEGRHELQLVVEIVADKNRKILLPSKKIPVMIKATQESFGHQFSVFMGKNWQWMITAVLIPVFIAWLTTRIRQRQQTPATPARKKRRK